MHFDDFSYQKPSKTLRNGRECVPKRLVPWPHILGREDLREHRLALSQRGVQVHQQEEGVQPRHRQAQLLATRAYALEEKGGPPRSCRPRGPRERLRHEDQQSFNDFSSLFSGFLRPRGLENRANSLDFLGRLPFWCEPQGCEAGQSQAEAGQWPHEAPGGA